MKKQILISFFLVTLLISAVINSCKKEEPEPLALVALVAGTIDLNGNETPANVPVKPTITATFNVDIDPASSTETNITLMQDYDEKSIDIEISVAAKEITITPASDLGTGTLYTLSFGTGLKSTDGMALTEEERSFCTEGTFTPEGAIAHFTFEDNADDQIGVFDPLAADIIDITYTASRNTAAGKAATFNGTTSIIEVPDGDILMNTTDFSLAFWVKTNSTGKIETDGHFIVGCAVNSGFDFAIMEGYSSAGGDFRYELADHSTAAIGMYFLALASPGHEGFSYVNSLTVNEMVALLKDKWLNVVYTFNSSIKTATLYYNGVKMVREDFKLWPTTDIRSVIGLKYTGVANGNNLALGYIQGRNNRTSLHPDYDYSQPNSIYHLKGQLDDVRIWHRAISEGEVYLMYNSEKP